MEAKGTVNDFAFIPLRKLIARSVSIEKLRTSLVAFACKKDEDVQNFLRKDAIDYEISNKSRTYICHDTKGTVVGYFTLAVHSIEASPQLIAKFSEKLKLSALKSFKYMRPFIPAYLLSLVGKDDNASVSGFLTHAMQIIKKAIAAAQDVVGGQIIYLDCQRNLMSLYEKQGFTYFRDNPDNKNNSNRNDDLFQMWQIL